MPYLDHAATTPLREEGPRGHAPVPPGRVRGIRPRRTGRGGARAWPSSERGTAWPASSGCEPAEVVLTSGGTEADNLALRGALSGAALRETGRPGLVTSAVEHEAVLHTAEALAEAGHPVAVLPPDAEGRLAARAVEAALTDETGLVSAMLVNNETGAVNDVAEIARVARQRGARVHTDAVQAAGLLPLDVEALGVDLLSLSAHKVGGPKGGGALYVRAGTPLVPVQTGGAQERRRRGGTENVAVAVGFAEALALAEAERVEHAARLGALRDRLLGRVREAFGERVGA